ncbi:hypothetical protein [Streptomyces sp. A012304]|uniref:hypothetical protein n=1 Tax=Streptomyces sp. A012304 TaxID=375446 RepID=UPI00222F7CED|nr:hypothetical protein [Streptomyces sp. A012304]GKQ39515.1 hypothetical protein ALMP_60420 [Streptomyces sp. A012304]
MKYRAVLTQTASCVVEFEAPEDATPEQLEAAALEAETPTLCHYCASSDRNQSLNIDGDWELFRDEDGKPEIAVDGDR